VRADCSGLRYASAPARRAASPLASWWSHFPVLHAETLGQTLGQASGGYEHQAVCVCVCELAHSLHGAQQLDA